MVSFNELVKHGVQLTDVVLWKADCEINEDSVLNELDVRVNVWSNVLNVDKGEVYLNIIVGKKGETVLYLDIVEKGICMTENPVQEDEFKVFLEMQGVRLVWSFARQTLYDMTSKMGVKPYILPTIDVAQTWARKEKEANE